MARFGLWLVTVGGDHRHPRGKRFEPICNYLFDLSYGFCLPTTPQRHHTVPELICRSFVIDPQHEQAEAQFGCVNMIDRQQANRLHEKLMRDTWLYRKSRK